MFQKRRRLAALIAPVCLFVLSSAFIPKEQVYDGGKELYEKKCARCHGKDGTKGLFGARNLQISKLDDAGYIKIITEGRNIMPSWQKKLSEGQINLVVLYIKGLRK